MTATATRLRTSNPADIRLRLINLGDSLAASNPERRSIIDTILTALVAGEHVLLLGEPGVGKSRLADGIGGALDAVLFDYLMTRFTEAAEIFGGVNVKKLADSGDIELNTRGRLPEAQIAFLDEIFKSNSAILNALLKVLNERRFFNDGAWHKAPLRFMIAASNEVPDEGDKSVEAFYDRILVRLFVDHIEDDGNFLDVFHRALPDMPTGVLSVDELDAATRTAAALPFSADADKAICAIRHELWVAGVFVSDRRWVQSGKFLQAHAWLQGLDEVTHGCVGALVPCLWSRVEQIGLVEERVERHAPSWESDVRGVNAVLLEQQAALSKVKGATKADAMATLGQITMVLDEKQSDVVDLQTRFASDKNATAGLAAVIGTIEAMRRLVVNTSIEVQTKRKT